MTQLERQGWSKSHVQDLHCAVHAGDHSCNAAALESSPAKTSKDAETGQVLKLTQIYQGTLNTQPVFHNRHRQISAHAVCDKTLLRGLFESIPAVTKDIH